MYLTRNVGRKSSIHVVFSSLCGCMAWAWRPLLKCHCSARVSTTVLLSHLLSGILQQVWFASYMVIHLEIRHCSVRCVTGALSVEKEDGGLSQAEAMTSSSSYCGVSLAASIRQWIFLLEFLKTTWSNSLCLWNF